MRKLFILLTIFSTSMIASAQVNWEFQIGGMFRKEYYDRNIRYYGDYSTGDGIDLLARLLLQIPVSHRVPIFIETGVGYRHKPLLSVASGYKFPGEDGEPFKFFEIIDGNFVELPVKCGYKLQLNEKNAFNFAAGPYLGVPFEQAEFSKSVVDVGLEASVEFRHRCMSFGIMWQNPVFLNGQRNYYKNSFLVTIGINIRGRKPNWDKIANVLEVTGNALNVVNSTLYGQSAEYSAEYIEDAGEIMDSSSSTGNYEAMYRNWERRAEANYNSITNLGYDIKYSDGKHTGGSGNGKLSASKYKRMKKALKEAQKEMEDIRRKARKAGIVIQQSPWETAGVSF